MSHEDLVALAARWRATEKELIAGVEAMFPVGQKVTVHHSRYTGLGEVIEEVFPSSEDMIWVACADGRVRGFSIEHVRRAT